MKIEYVLLKELTPYYEFGVKSLLKEADLEFVPPLSKRKSSTDKSFNFDNNDINSYYGALKSQSFILALDEGKLIGFLSYIPEHDLTLDGQTLKCDYISTIIVSKKYRKHKVCSEMYKILFKNNKNVLVTRTWSENVAHINILEKFGFTNFKTIKNERGAGIDTVYFMYNNAL